MSLPCKNYFILCIIFDFFSFSWAGRSLFFSKKVLKQCLLCFSFGESELCSSLTSSFIIRNCFLSQNYLPIWYIRTHVQSVYHLQLPPTSTRIMDFVEVIMWVDNLRKKKLLLHNQIDWGASRNEAILSEKEDCSNSKYRSSLCLSTSAPNLTLILIDYK